MKKLKQFVKKHLFPGWVETERQNKVLSERLEAVKVSKHVEIADREWDSRNSVIRIDGPLYLAINNSSLKDTNLEFRGVRLDEHKSVVRLFGANGRIINCSFLVANNNDNNENKKRNTQGFSKKR